MERTKADNEAIKELVDRLEQLGYYKYMKPELVAKAKEQAVSSGEIFMYYDGAKEAYETGTDAFRKYNLERHEEEIRRAYYMDIRMLGRRELAKFLAEITSFLRSQGVEIFQIEEDFNVKGRYAVYVNGSEYVMYSQGEVSDLERSGYILELATVRTFAIINKLLEDANAENRAYLLYDGDMTSALFITAEMYNAFQESTVIPKIYKPVSADVLLG